MRLIIAACIMSVLSTPAFAECSQADAVAKMQTILGSGEYSAFVSSAGKTKPTSAQREASKAGLRAYGGNAGRAVAGMMQDRDNAAQLAQAEASVANVTAFNQTLNEAGSALGQGDNAKACNIYDTLILGLGIAP